MIFIEEKFILSNNNGISKNECIKVKKFFDTLQEAVDFCENECSYKLTRIKNINANGEFYLAFDTNFYNIIHYHCFTC